MGGNSVIIGGIIKAPLYFDDYDALCVELNIYREDLGKVEELILCTKDPQVIKKAASELNVGDYFFTSNAYLKTTTYIRRKQLECSECHNMEYQKVKSERTEVVFTDFNVFTPKDGKVPSGVNKVFLYGNICSEINYREKDGRSYCKYKLAVNHNIYDTDAEYPFVVTFGKDAELSNKYLERNSRVFVEGSIQQRVIKQSTNYVCSNCGVMAVKQVPNYVRETIVNNVVFLDKKHSEEE